MKKSIEYQFPKRKQPVFYCFKSFLRIFNKKVRVVTLGGDLDAKCVYLSNHANKMGPMIYDMFFPIYNVKWGTHEMLEDYSARKAYLKDVLYIQKNHMGRKMATFKASFEAFFSKFVYRGIKVLPTYSDVRLMRTVKKSIDVLDNQTALLIFPENSSHGYSDVISEFFLGFILVMRHYRRVHGEDIAVRPTYYHKRKRLIVVGEPYYLNDFDEKGIDKHEIAETLRDKVNSLFHRIESGEFEMHKKRKNVINL